MRIMSQTITRLKKINPVWYLVMLVMLIPIIYTLFQFSNPDYFDGFIGNWFSTLIGVIIGIPIALELSRMQQKKEETARQQLEKIEEAKQARTREKEALEHQKKILSLLLNEITHDVDHLQREPQNVYARKRLENFGYAWESQESQYIRKLNVWNSYNLIKVESWKLFTGGGEIQWIKDLDVLDNLALAYFLLNNFITQRDAFKNTVASMKIENFQSNQEFSMTVDLMYETFSLLLKQTADEVQILAFKLIDSLEEIDKKLSAFSDENVLNHP